MSNYPRLAFISAFVQQMLKARNLSFIYQGETLSPAELADPQGFLPVFLESALAQMNKASHEKWRPAVNYLFQESSICYLVPLPEVLNFPLGPLTLCLDFALEKYVDDFLATQPIPVAQRYRAGNPLLVPLDGLIDDFLQRYQDGQLRVTVPPAPPEVPVTPSPLALPSASLPATSTVQVSQGS